MATPVSNVAPCPAWGSKLASIRKVRGAQKSLNMALESADLDQVWHPGSVRRAFRAKNRKRKLVQSRQLSSHMMVSALE